MFGTAIVCTNLSSESDTLVSCARTLSVLGVREAVLTHVVDASDDFRPEFAQTGAAEELYARQFESLVSSGMAVRVEAPIGQPVLSLEEIRLRHRADLLVMGSVGAGTLDDRGTGTISADLLQRTNIPVLLTSYSSAPGEIRPLGMCPTVLRKVLCCVDSPETQSRFLNTLVDLVNQGVSHITLLHVQDRRFSMAGYGSWLPEHNRRDAVRMVRMRDALVAAGAVDRVSTELMYGSPAEEIMRRSVSGEYSLVVLGNRPRCASHELQTLGTAHDSVVRQTVTPVLVVPSGETAAVA